MQSFDPSEIGFNNDVEHEGRRLHVQTEVVGRTQVIRTSVLENGTIKHVESHPYPEDVSTDEERARALVLSRHKQVIDKVREGTVS